MNDDLIARLDAAPEGSRELSNGVLIACGWRMEYESGSRIPPHWVRPDGMIVPRDEAPDPTTSIDDAVAVVVPEGCRWDVQQDRTAAFASIDGETTGRCSTPALAVCIAGRLKARAAGSAVIEGGEAG